MWKFSKCSVYWMISVRHRSELWAQFLQSFGGASSLASGFVFKFCVQILYTDLDMRVDSQYRDKRSEARSFCDITRGVP